MAPRHRIDLHFADNQHLCYKLFSVAIQPNSREVVHRLKPRLIV
jgi:hypothetical protein